MFTLPHLFYFIWFELEKLHMFTPELVNKHQHLVLNDSMLLMKTQPLALFRERNGTPFIFKLNFARRTWYELVDEQADILVRAHPRAPKKSSIQIESSDKLKCGAQQQRENEERNSKFNRNWMKFFHETMCQVLIACLYCYYLVSSGFGQSANGQWESSEFIVHPAKYSKNVRSEMKTGNLKRNTTKLTGRLKAK